MCKKKLPIKYNGGGVGGRCFADEEKPMKIEEFIGKSKFSLPHVFIVLMETADSVNIVDIL